MKIIKQQHNTLLKDEWLTVTEIRCLIADSLIQKNRINSSLKELYDSGVCHNWVRHDTPKTYKLNKKYIEQFCNKYGFELVTPINRDAPDYKTQDWLNPRELTRYFAYHERKIIKILDTLKNKMPQAIQIKQNGRLSCLCLHKDYIEYVLSIVSLSENLNSNHQPQKNGIKPCVNTNESDEWITLSAARNLIMDSIVLRKQIRDSFERLYNSDEHPEWFKNKSDTSKQFLFNKKYLKDFCVLCGFEMREQIDNNVKWLSVYDLTQRYLTRQIPEGFSKSITNALRDLHTNPPYSNMVCKYSQERFGLNPDYLELFANTYGFKIKCKDKRTEDWITPTQLCTLVHGITPPQMNCLLKEYQNQMPEWIKTKISYQLSCLCLHRDHVAEFCHIAKLKMCESMTKTPNWLVPYECRLYLKDFDENTQMDSLVFMFEIQSKTHPDWLQYKITKSGKQVLCLNKKYLPQFCAATGFVCDNAKTEQWLNAKELCCILNMSPATILNILQKHKDVYPDIIKTRYKYSFSYLCLRADCVDMVSKWKEQLNKTTTMLELLQYQLYANNKLRQ
ncbi:MAG: hypothetical protein IJL05_01465 [Alphaproteobacteria bacterium]|nr:hypothetical protein [Alphaproteobacteria bacterium]